MFLVVSVLVPVLPVREEQANEKRIKDLLSIRNSLLLLVVVVFQLFKEIQTIQRVGERVSE